MNGKNFKRIIALILITLMTFASAACSSKTKTEKFLEKFEKILADYSETLEKSIENPENEALKAQLEKMNSELDKSVEEAKKLREGMNEKKQTNLNTRMREVFLTVCSNKAKMEIFLKYFEKVLIDYFTLEGESMNNPDDKALKAQLEETDAKLKRVTEEAEKIKEGMSGEEQKDFDAKMQGLFVKTRAEKFLEKFEKILTDYITLSGESMKNPNDEALKAQLEKTDDKLKKATEEAKKLRESMSGEEQKDFDAKMQELFVKSLMPGG